MPQENFEKLPEQKSKLSPQDQEAYQRLRGLERSTKAEQAHEKEYTKEVEELNVQSAEVWAEVLELDGQDPTEQITEGVELDEVSTKVQEEMDKLREQLGAKEKGLEQEAYGRLEEFARKRRKYLKAKDKLNEITQERIRHIYQSPRLKEAPQVWKKVAVEQEKLSLIEQKLENLSRTSPEAFKAHWLLRLRDYKKQFEDSGIIETPAIEAQTAELMHNVRKQLEGTNRVATLLGPTGSGKTVMAEKVARAFSPDGNYEFVSAHSKMDPEDILSRQGITISTTKPEEVPDSIVEAKRQFQDKHPDLSEEELAEQEQIIEQVIQGQAEQKTYQTETILEAIGRAAQEGRVVVVDEFNYLPPQTLASLNKLLDTKEGRVANISVGDQEREFEVKEGFGIIFTGNVGQEYIGRQDRWDPALVNRILAGTLEYEYPPQDIDSSFENSIISNENLAEGQKPPNRELFLTSLVQLIDRKGNLTAPDGALEEVWNIGRTFSLVQQLAAGKDFREVGVERTEELQDISEFKFDTIFLSFRNLNQVVREWKLDGYRQPLESYVFNKIIRPATVIDENEAAQLFYLFKHWGNFFQAEVYSEVEVDATTWRISGVNTVSSKFKTEAEPNKHFTPKEVVEAASGMETPSYEQLGAETAQSRQEMISLEQEQAEMIRWLENQEKELAEDQFVENICKEKEAAR